MKIVINYNGQLNNLINLNFFLNSEGQIGVYS